MNLALLLMDILFLHRSYLIERILGYPSFEHRRKAAKGGLGLACVEEEGEVQVLRMSQF